MKKYIWMFLLTLAGIFNVHAQATLSIDNFKIKPGEEKEIAIKMTNTVPIRALQVQVTLPECLTLVARPAIVPERQGSYIDDFGETVSAVKALNYNKLNDGGYMITVNADDGVPFAGNEGAIITMKVKADESAALKESAITLQNIELVYEDGETYIRPSQSTCTVTVYQLFVIEVIASEGGTIAGGGSYESGSKVTLTATPEDGYRFVKWSDGTTDNPYTFKATENKSLAATFESIPYYTIIYMVDGAEYKRVSVMSGSKIVAETNPVKEGHSFTGWNGLPEIMPEQDVTVTGIFTANSYTLTYVLDGATFKTETVTYGTAISTPEVPAKEGHTFAGWTGVPATMPAKDVTMTGTYTINKYTLTYMVDGTVYKMSELEYGAIITAEAAPIKEGHTFSGWSEIPVTMPAKDVTVTGIFTANSYKVTYILGGKTFKTETVTYGTAIPTPEVPAKEGYNFSGWGEVPATMPAKDLTFTGSYIINKDLKYNLVYMVDGTEYKRVTIDFGDAIILETAPTKEGHTFSGWSEVPETMPLHDVTVTGTFTANSYTLTYVLDGETFKTETVTYGTAISTPEVPAKEGHTFAGWTGVPATMPAKDVTVTGTFTANSYKVTYILDGKTFKTETVTYGTAIPTPEVPAKEGYNFSGWGEVPATMPAKDLTFTGSYTINKDLKYNLVYMVDGTEYKRVTIAFGDAITLEAAPTKEGHTFSGWSEVPETMPLHDVTITGAFTVNIYTVVYKVDGEVYATEEVAYGETVVLKEEPVKEGYLFSGWCEIPETMPAKDIEVTGHFEVDGIDAVLTDRLVDVYTLQGVMLKRQISIDELRNELSRGIYIINGKKIIMK